MAAFQESSDVSPACANVTVAAPEVMDDASDAASDIAEAGMTTTDDSSHEDTHKTTEDNVAEDDASATEATRQQTNASASLLDRAQVFWSQSASAVRSQVSKHSRTQPSGSTPDSDASTTQAVNVVDDQTEQEEEEEAQQVSEPSSTLAVNGDKVQRASGEIIGDCTSTGSWTLEGTAVENETPAADFVQDGTASTTLVEWRQRMGMASADDVSLASADGSVSTDNASLTEATCQQVDASASLLDRAQVFLSQSVSAVRSQVSKPASPSISTTESANAVDNHPESANAVDAHPEEETQQVSVVVEATAEAAAANVTTVPSGALGEVADAASDMAEAGTPMVDDTRFHKDTPEATEDVFVSEAAPQVDAAASLLDRAQVFFSKSVSAVRAQVPGRAQYSMDEAGKASDSHVDADIVTSSEEVVCEEATSTDVTSDHTLEIPAAPATLEASDEAQSTVASNATRLDRAQVFVSSAASALRSQVSALTRPTTVIVA